MLSSLAERTQLVKRFRNAAAFLYIPLMVAAVLPAMIVAVSQVPISASTATIIGFAAACILSTWPGNALVEFCYSEILRAPSPNSGEVMGKWLDRDKPDPNLVKFRSKTAWIIGALERILYIYALHFSQPSLITGVLILKAFFAWTDRPNLIPSVPDPAQIVHTILETKARYYTYIVGNLLSLVLAILLYEGFVHWFPKLFG